jgi:hypothetical protein
MHCTALSSDSIAIATVIDLMASAFGGGNDLHCTGSVAVSIVLAIIAQVSARMVTMRVAAAVAVVVVVVAAAVVAMSTVPERNSMTALPATSTPLMRAVAAVAVADSVEDAVCTAPKRSAPNAPSARPILRGACACAAFSSCSVR